jgi:hypothetical protein
MRESAIDSRNEAFSIREKRTLCGIPEFTHPGRPECSGRA